MILYGNDRQDRPAQLTTRQLQARRRRLAATCPTWKGSSPGRWSIRADAVARRDAGAIRELHGPYTYVVLPRFGAAPARSTCRRGRPRRCAGERGSPPRCAPRGGDLGHQHRAVVPGELV